MGKATLRALLVPVSGNAKVGPVAVSYTESVSCPTACPLQSTGACYAKHGHAGMAWRKVDVGAGNVAPWPEFVARVRTLPRGSMFRHNVAGDLPGVADKLDAPRLASLVAAVRSKRLVAWTYTHKPVIGHRYAAARDAIRDANANGFTINLSANTLRHADMLSDLAIAPVVVVLPADAPDKVHTPAGRVVQVCPEQTGKLPNCAACGACAAAGRRAIIGFRAHGVGARAATSVAQG